MKSQISCNKDSLIYKRISESSKKVARSANFFLIIMPLIVSNNLLAQSSNITDKSLNDKVKQTLKKNAETLRFMENKGQIANKDVLYYYEGKNGSAFIERNKIRFIANDDTLVTALNQNGITKKERKRKATHAFSITMINANSSPSFQLGSSFKTKYNFFLGGAEKDAVTGVKAAKDLIIKDIYAGIDLRLYSSPDGSLEFDWILDPGADFRKVQLNFHGQDNLSINANGDLVVGLRFTNVKFSIPESYQISEEGKMPVQFSFNRLNKNSIAFTSKSKINSRYGLVIDPILNWGTLMDGNLVDFDEYLFAIQVDPSDGMVYCAGTTNRQISTASTPYDADGYKNTITGLTGGTGASSLPNVAIIYRINSTGTDLVDLTLYGPNSVSGTNDVTAYALSLSTNRVFIGGATNATTPGAGAPFDNTRNSTDGYIAVFSRDLGTLVYRTFLGGNTADSRGVTSIRAINDQSYVVGMTVADSVPTVSPKYISSGAAQTTYGGGTDMYIAKFTNMSVLSWGTYIGGSGNETFNDLEILSDGRVAFCGYTTGTFTLTNSVGHTGSNEDGVIGVLKSNGTGFNYLDRIGGSGNDRFYDVEIVGESLYFSGSGASGYPTTAGVYDQTFNGGSIDAVIGTVSTTGGSASYKATYYGSSGTDFGDGIRLVTKIGCPTSETLILAFGTVGASGMPVLNVKNESFYNPNFTPGGNSGLDMFFSGFTTDLTTLKYGTYMGGDQDDYLGETGDPRGANQLWVNGTDAYVGTTTHSSSHTPTILSGGFDVIKSNGVNDSHIIFSIAFGGIFDTVSLDPLSATSNKSFVCPGEAAVLTVNGGYLGTGASWEWYTGSCGGTLIGSGASITVYPMVTTTYYVRAEGNCNNTTCAQVTVPVTCILAVQNIALNGSMVRRQANLSWKITSNAKVNNIDVERSSDAATFSIIKSIDVNGYVNSDGYNMKDNVSPLEGNYVYYRVKFFTGDEKVMYSKTLPLALNGNTMNAVLIPNPANTTAKVGFYTDGSSNVEIRLFNAQSQLVRRASILTASGYNSYKFEQLDRLPNGIYYVTITNANSSSQLKLIIQ